MGSTTDLSQDASFDCELFPQPQIDMTDLDAFLANTPANLTQAVSLPTMWPDWGYENFAASAGSSSPWGNV
jgi:hypothetical protein